MPIAHAIVPHLPFLRRYARALTGSQVSGDAYVRASLEAIIADPDQVDLESSPRVQLYRIFNAIWESSHFPDLDERVNSTGDGEINRRLHALTMPFRQALLLTAMEGFSEKEVGLILGISTEEVRLLAEGAMREMLNQSPTDVLIIEDEPIISLDLRNIVEDMGHTVSAVAITRDEAVDAALTRPPGLVLADIQLADRSSGIDAVKDILRNEQTPVIFITAYPERLLTGDRPEPTFLITKPFIGNAVKAAISQALFMRAS